MRKTPAGDQAPPRPEAPARVPQADPGTARPAAVRPGSSARQVALERLVRLLANVAGAAAAVFFAHASLQFYLRTHQLIGGAFFVEQTWFVIVFLIRRPPKAASRGLGGWARRPPMPPTGSGSGGGCCPAYGSRGYALSSMTPMR